MRVLLNTTPLSLATVRDVLVFAAPPSVTAYSVELRESDRYPFKGLAHRLPTWHVALWIGTPRFYPYRPRQERHAGGYLPTPLLADPVEALVYVAAHELRHLWQNIVPRGRRVWGARGQFSERDADAYAIRTLRAWRRRSPSSEIVQ